MNQAAYSRSRPRHTRVGVVTRSGARVDQEERTIVITPHGGHAPQDIESEMARTTVDQRRAQQREQQRTERFSRVERRYGSSSRFAGGRADEMAVPPAAATACRDRHRRSQTTPPASRWARLPCVIASQRQVGIRPRHDARPACLGHMQFKDYYQISRRTHERWRGS